MIKQMPSPHHPPLLLHLESKHPRQLRTEPWMPILSIGKLPLPFTKPQRCGHRDGRGACAAGEAVGDVVFGAGIAGGESGGRGDVGEDWGDRTAAAAGGMRERSVPLGKRRACELFRRGVRR